MLHHPTDAYDKLEEISGLVKQTNFKIKDPQDEHEINKEAGVIKMADKLNQIQMAKDLLNEVANMVEDSDKRFVSKDVNCVISDFVNDSEILEQAGIGFGENGSFLIQKSLKRLAKVSGAIKLKFFGKIMCS
jgi:hydrogenase maturation factor HypE